MIEKGYDFLASNNKCKVCGYKFGRNDGMICPECLSSRETDIDCDGLSDDLHSHDIGFGSDKNKNNAGFGFFFKNDMTEAEKQLEKERFQAAQKKEAYYEKKEKLKEQMNAKTSRYENTTFQRGDQNNQSFQRNNVPNRNVTAQTFTTSTPDMKSFTTTAYQRMASNGRTVNTTFNNTKSKRNNWLVIIFVIIFIGIFVFSSILPAVIDSINQSDYDYYEEDYYEKEDYFQYSLTFDKNFDETVALSESGVCAYVSSPSFIDIEPSLMDEYFEEEVFGYYNSTDDLLTLELPVTVYNYSDDNYPSDLDIRVYTEYTDEGGDVYTATSYPLMDMPVYEIIPDGSYSYAMYFAVPMAEEYTIKLYDYDYIRGEETEYVFYCSFSSETEAQDDLTADNYADNT